MVVEIVFNVNPTTIVYGNKIAISGSVHEDGVPLDTQNVQIMHVESGNLLFDLYADANGNYGVDWYPGIDWVGIFQLQAFVPIYEGKYSSPITVEVLEEIVPIIEIYVNPQSCKIGTVFSFSGILMRGGTPIYNETVNLVLDGVGNVGFDLTDMNGIYLITWMADRSGNLTFYANAPNV